MLTPSRAESATPAVPYSTATGKTVLTNLAHVYSPNMVQVEGKLYLYFGGWDYVPATGLPHDRVYRVECNSAFSCSSAVEVVLDPLPYGLWHFNDPSIVQLTLADGRSYFIMYGTGVIDDGDPNSGYTVPNNKVYYSTSWADDGRNWSPPKLAIDGAWVAGATVRDGNVFVYGNSTENGLIYRYEMGPSGIDPNPVRREVHFTYPNGSLLPVSYFYLNVEVMWRPQLGLYQMLAERIIDWQAGTSTIDILHSEDGLTFHLVREAIIQADPNSKRVLTPAPFPDTHCWVYFGEMEGDSKTNIRVIDWCNGS